MAVTDKLAHRTEPQQSQDTLVAVFGEHFAASGTSANCVGPTGTRSRRSESCEPPGTIPRHTTSGMSLVVLRACVVCGDEYVC